MKKLVLINCIVAIIIVSCDTEKQNDSSFILKPEYDSIRSCPEYGGVFIVSLTDSLTTSGYIDLSLDASTDLNASLTKTKISREFPVAEVIIKPGKNIQINDYEIKLNASNEVCDTTINLFVAVYDWPAEIGEGPSIKKDEYISWLQDEFSELNITPAKQWFAYPTYPQIIIVEHVTLLNDDYEFRICTHAMIPPYDWSMIRLRKRNEITPFFAARQDSTGGEFYEIPVEKYPEMLGY